MKRVLVIAPHADDEVLGAGATIRKFSEEGARIRLLVLTNRLFPRAEGDPKLDTARATAETSKVCELLGIHEFSIAGFTDKELPERRKELIALFEDERDGFQPQLVLIPDSEDTHQDHRATHEAACIVWRPHLAAIHGARVWSYQAPSSYGFVPDIYVPVALEHVKAKQEAMLQYTTEVLPHPSTRSSEFILFQASYWGGVTQQPYAESFRHVIGVY